MVLFKNIFFRIQICLDANAEKVTKTAIVDPVPTNTQDILMYQQPPKITRLPGTISLLM